MTKYGKESVILFAYLSFQVSHAFCEAERRCCMSFFLDASSRFR